ncbi:hypothetical protein CAEBREN_19261 [Caenorhabditis brenneri]|uniref:Uncharacterized protein n=1 Tax=Caenorhabditis brenneri TaxID=135651 RepID=G0NXH6_CAEBE|nr:hypothetical protein CAEBREN_19261 [Caenorhabditis brenneri]
MEKKCSMEDLLSLASDDFFDMLTERLECFYEAFLLREKQST